MMDKIQQSLAAAVTDIFDGASVMIGGFGEAGSPIELIHALIDQGARDLTVISNNAGNGHVGLAALIQAGRVKKMICSYPRSSNSTVFADLYKAGKIELELVPQGTLAARMQLGGSGIPAFYTPTGVGTPLAEGRETRIFNGKEYLLEEGMLADFALVRCHCADAMGNLTYHMAARNFGPVMCMAAETTIVQALSVVPVGALDPEKVVTPGIFVDRVIEVSNAAHESELVSNGVTYP
ncbi:3-oxoacid CoA-transferase subunit A [Geopsychrobacter electrodiphilus]|uniref:3-oxoacid CoA-transferase subunit A n=1 Tax=Geopsychrobacter electrodiphilus TaxID=225196 RepID=UPI0003810EAC|nr:3-oxoacid CoA-transferase subunit A [Geopsychrobacter electrodiphilus]